MFILTKLFRFNFSKPISGIDWKIKMVLAVIEYVEWESSQPYIADVVFPIIKKKKYYQ